MAVQIFNILVGAALVVGALITFLFRNLWYLLPGAALWVGLRLFVAASRHLHADTLGSRETEIQRTTPEPTTEPRDEPPSPSPPISPRRQVWNADISELETLSDPQSSASLAEVLAEELLIGENLLKRVPLDLMSRLPMWVQPITEEDVLQWELRVAARLGHEGFVIEKARFLADPDNTFEFPYAGQSLKAMRHPLRERLDHRLAVLEGLIRRFSSRGH